MTDLPEQLPDARAVLAAAYERVRNADDGLRSFLDACEQAEFAAQFAISMRSEQAQALAGIGAGLATVEAVEQATAVKPITTDYLPAAHIADAWQSLNYSARGVVQKHAPTLADKLDALVDLLGGRS